MQTDSYRLVASMDSSFKISVFLSIILATSRADVAHFFAPEFGYFSQPPQQQYPNHHYHTQQHLFQPLQPPQQTLPSLYAAPPGQQQQSPPQGYLNPAAPTPSPVAPIPSSTFAAPEFTLPEIVENRIAKDNVNFIPLSNHYLPPEDRPNYESPKPPNQSDGSSSAHIDGYYYPRPTVRPTTTTTTSERPNPIVVLDPPVVLPPINSPAEVKPPNYSEQGYDYNAPSPVMIVPAKPISTPAPTYLPPNSDGGIDVAVIEQTAESGAPPLRLRVQEMRCLHNAGGYFRTVLKVESFIGATPSVDNDSNDKRCELKLHRSYVVVDILEIDFHKCGVHSCDKDLCLRIRFPAIRGMRTSADAILTLHCKSQERIAAKTHALKMGVANDIQSRSMGTYAHGGTQNPLRTHVELLRKSHNGFTRHLETNGAVELGEDLLLRAHVLEGNGWNYTKLTDVSLQRIAASGELLNLARLITDRGCLNPSMKGISAHPPSFDPPLGHKLALKAVMFQGMHSGEELVISMRITGCLESQDCYINTQDCNAINTGRRRRNSGDLLTPERNVNSTEISEISRISFRVIMNPVEDKAAKVTEYEDKDARGNELRLKEHSFVLFGSIGFVLLMCGLGLFAALKFKS